MYHAITDWGCSMRTVARAVLPVLLATLAAASVAEAVTTYSYVGGHFGDASRGVPPLAGVYTIADGISGSFTVADGFLPGDAGNGGRTAIFLGQGYDGVLAYSFTDGHQTLTRANSTATIALGIPFYGQWEIRIEGVTGGGIHTAALLDDRGDYGFLDANNYGWNDSDTQNSGGRGAWTATVPEPMSLGLVLTGLSALAGACWRSGKAGRARRG
jgi:hypothetical protein